MNYLLDEKDINMGNEDRWTLVVADDKSSVIVEHWWSHRSGRDNFSNGTEKVTLKELQRKKNQLYNKAIEYLNSIGFNTESNNMF